MQAATNSPRRIVTHLTFGLAKMAWRKGESLGLKPFRASKEWAISSASTNPAPLVSSPRQRSAGRGLWRGELANRHRDQRTISHPESSVPPLPDPPHQSGLMEREKEAVDSIGFLNQFEPRRSGPFQAHPPTQRLWFPRPASEARGEDYGEGKSQKDIAVNEPSHIPKAQSHPSPTLPFN